MARRAFSTAELVIATLILGAALIPIYSIFTSGSKTAGNSKYAYIAAQVARETMDELRTLPFEELEKANIAQPTSVTGPLFGITGKLRILPGGAEDPNGVANAQSPQYPADYARIKRTITITAVDGSSIPKEITGQQKLIPRLKKAVVDVSWQEHGGKDEKSRPGLMRYVSYIGYHSVDPEVPE
jgi:hypothetical protein